MNLISSRSRLLLVAVAAMVGGVVFHAAHALTGVGGPGLDDFTTNGVYTAVELLAVAVCAGRALRRRDDRWVWALMAFGLLTWTGGDLVWTLWLNNLANPPFPSVADPLYLAMYPAMYVAIMLLIRSRIRDAGAAQWLDGGIVGLALAAIGAGLIMPTILALSSGQIVKDAVNLAYPLGDLTLLAFVVAAMSLSGWRPTRMWTLLGAGMATDAIADLVFAYQSARGTYVPGGILDTMWPAAMTLIALAAWQPVERRRVGAVPAPQTIALSVLAGAAALGLLVCAAFVHVTPAAVGLAAAALVAAAVRGLLTYAENVRILRRSADQVITDDLSGLGNRRCFLRDLEEAIAHADQASPWTLAFFDLNGFKNYNDTFGHAAGDALLARVGATLRTAVAESGHAYRLGGDEFCVLVHGRLARDDETVIAAANALSERGSGFAISCAYGVAVVPDDTTTASAVLQLADQRMYADKARSRRLSHPRTHDVLMTLLSERTPELHHHVSGVGELVADLGRAFSMDATQIDELLLAAELHDVGKLAIPDEILDKPRPLNESEWQFMRQHPAIGERILNADPAMRPVARLVRASHERWDGTGYPDHLAGSQIPLGARIIAACDAFEAMTSDRCYQAARTPAAAIDELRRNAGSQFDPTVVQALCARLVRSQAAAAVAPHGGAARVAPRRPDRAQAPV
jgi:diguanylate cyclase (GGDEF)-like protein